MFYKHFDPKNKAKSEASYVGLIHFEGKVGDKTGTFVLEDVGTFHEGTARSVLKIIDGSGTDGLKEIQGRGNYWADKENNQFELEYSFEEEIEDVTRHSSYA